MQQRNARAHRPRPVPLHAQTHAQQDVLPGSAPTLTMPPAFQVLAQSLRQDSGFPERGSPGPSEKRSATPLNSASLSPSSVPSSAPSSLSSSSSSIVRANMPSMHDQDGGAGRDGNGEEANTSAASSSSHPCSGDRRLLPDPTGETDEGDSAEGINGDDKSDAAERDQYGFLRRSAFVPQEKLSDWHRDYATYMEMRKQKWETLFREHGLDPFSDMLGRFPPRSKVVARYIRKGVPSRLRGGAWFYYSGAYTLYMRQRELYASLLAECPSALSIKDANAIDRDLYRTFPDNKYFMRAASGGSSSSAAAAAAAATTTAKTSRPNEAESQELQIDTFLQGHPNENEAISRLRRVLAAFAVYRPQIGYCQSLNFLAGMFLLFLDEEKTFWLLSVLTQQYLPGEHDINLEGSNVDQGVFMLMVQENLPEVWEKICHDLDGQALSDLVINLPPITLVTSGWFMSAFSGSLPVETVLRIWDCMFYDGSAILFRCALALMKLGEPNILPITDDMEVFQAVQSIPRTLIDPRPLVDLIYRKHSGFARISQQEVNNKRALVRAHRLAVSTSKQTTAFPKTLPALQNTPALLATNASRRLSRLRSQTTSSRR